MRGGRGTSSSACTGGGRWQADAAAPPDTDSWQPAQPAQPAPEHDVEHHGVIRQAQPLVQLEVHLAAVHDLRGGGGGGRSRWGAEMMRAGEMRAGLQAVELQVSCALCADLPASHPCTQVLPLPAPPRHRHRSSAPARPRRPCGSFGRRRAGPGPGAGASAPHTCVGGGRAHLVNPRDLTCAGALGHCSVARYPRLHAAHAACTECATGRARQRTAWCGSRCPPAAAGQRRGPPGRRPSSPARLRLRGSAPQHRRRGGTVSPGPASNAGSRRRLQQLAAPSLSSRPPCNVPSPSQPARPHPLCSCGRAPPRL